MQIPVNFSGIWLVESENTFADSSVRYRFVSWIPKKYSEGVEKSLAQHEKSETRNELINWAIIEKTVDK